MSVQEQIQVCDESGSAVAGAIDDDQSLFVLANMKFTLCHEISHALIDELEVPVLGREEDVADALAAFHFLHPRALRCYPSLQRQCACHPD